MEAGLEMDLPDWDRKAAELVSRRPSLFWSQAAGTPSPELVVETILNHGDFDDFRHLCRLLDLREVATIFHRQVNRPRHNYRPRAINFFRLYFNRHASRNPE